MPSPALSLVPADSEFRKFHDLMARKVQNILLVSTPYDAWVLEEDGNISDRLVSEYRGLNLSRPPRLFWASRADEALRLLSERVFELVILMPQLAECEATDFAQRIKAQYFEIPIYFLSHSEAALPCAELASAVDNHFVWTGDADLLVALVKHAEDVMNVDADTASLGIRVIIVVEDSPAYRSSLLPLLYRELVSQTQDVIREGLNQEHRLLTMRCRPKILLAATYEEALGLFEKFEPYVLGVLSDVRFPRAGILDPSAGVDLLTAIKARRFDIPLLLMSNEPTNAARAQEIPAFFVDKNLSALLADVRRFMLDHLGFGEFIFRDVSGTEIARAGSIHRLEERLAKIPADALIRHCRHNDFSRWFFARTEFDLARRLRPLSDQDFASPEKLRRGLLDMIRVRREERRQRVIATFNPGDFDPATEFCKMGRDSLGGKGRGLGFLYSLLARLPGLREKYENVDFVLPKTLSLAVDIFDAFIRLNGLQHLSRTDLPDADVARCFRGGRFPGRVRHQLKTYLAHIHHPLAVRSSSLLEDAQFHAYAGLYATVMLPNNNPSLDVRLEELLAAIRHVYSSTFFQAPRAFSRRVGQRMDDEKMGALIQQLMGEDYGGFFYPVLSGVAQSFNYYPFGRARPEDGVVSIAFGLGKSVMDGEEVLRFSPRHPHVLPQFPNVDAAVRLSQTQFYSLRLDAGGSADTDFILIRRHIMDAENEGALGLVASTFLPEEGRIRDTFAPADKPRVLLFAPVLKHKILPLADILTDVLQVAEAAMACPVEVEIACNLYPEKNRKPTVSLLQLRPMSARAEQNPVTISTAEESRAVCLSRTALGNIETQTVGDILYVRPDTFEVEHTAHMAAEIGRLNAQMLEQDRKYVLIGPGRWGTTDHWLGIPVTWKEISAVAAIVETASDKLRVEPSQGSHFFHNITTLGIPYLTITESDSERFDWDWLGRQQAAFSGDYVRHVRLPRPLTIKVDGRSSHGVILPGSD